jgi:hypothetical protein
MKKSYRSSTVYVHGNLATAIQMFPTGNDPADVKAHWRIWI